jgi:hypothetical protein
VTEAALLGVVHESVVEVAEDDSSSKLVSPHEDDEAEVVDVGAGVVGSCDTFWSDGL